MVLTPIPLPSMLASRLRCHVSSACGAASCSGAPAVEVSSCLPRAAKTQSCCCAPADSLVCVQVGRVRASRSRHITVQCFQQQATLAGERLKLKQQQHKPFRALSRTQASSCVVQVAGEDTYQINWPGDQHAFVGGAQWRPEARVQRC